jgi:cytochrome c oxidase assembly protein subunit 15
MTANAAAISAPSLARATSDAAPSHALRTFAWSVLAYNVAVVVWGAAVRATGSGAGCGEHWPLCNGTVLQHHPGIGTLIELAHRASSGVDLIAILALVFFAFRATGKYHAARFWAAASLVLTLNEAVLGALLVLLGKTANDQSTSRGVYLALHFTNTLLLLAALTLTAHFLTRATGFMRGSTELRTPRLAAIGLTATLATGVMGSLAALGDTLYPSTNLWTSLAQDFSAHSSWLLRLRWVHPALSLIAGAFLVWIVARNLAKQNPHRPLALAVLALLLFQYLLGVADVTLLAPTWLQLLHLLGADLLWIALVLLAARTCIVPIGCPFSAGMGSACRISSASNSL